MSFNNNSKARGPPPPVAKKPAFLCKDLQVSPNINKLNSSLTEELNRKLATHLTLPKVPNKDALRNSSQPKTPPLPPPKSFDRSFDRNKDDNATSELQNVFAKRNSIGYEDNMKINNQQSLIDSSLSAPKYGHGSTLTEVTKIIDNQRDAQDLDSTLEFSLTDNPFDGTQSRDDIIAAPTFGNTPSEFMDDLPMILPPPDMSMFDDMSEPITNEGGGYTDDEEFMAPDFPDSNEVSDINLFIPPPPPEMYDSDEDSYSETNFDHERYQDDDNDDSMKQDDEDEEEDDDDDEDEDEDDNFLNNVQNFLDNVQSNDDSVGEMAEDVDTVINDMLLPAPVLTDTEDITYNTNDMLLPAPVLTDTEDVTYNTNNYSNSVQQNNNESLNNESIGVPVDFSSPQDLPVKSVTNEKQSLPGKVAKNSVLVNNLNNILKKQINDAESPTKSSELRNSDQWDTSNSNDKGLSFEQSSTKVELDSSFVAQKSQNDTVSTPAHWRDNKVDDIQPPADNVNMGTPSKLISPLENSSKKSSTTTTDLDTMESKSPSYTKTFDINVSFESTNNKPLIAPSSVTPTNNPSLTNNLNNILKRQMSNAGAPVKLSDIRKNSQSDKENFNPKEQVGMSGTSGRSTPAIDFDSGFSTARSQDGSVNGKNPLGNNKSDELLFTTMPVVDSRSSPDNKSPQLSQMSRTFSSSTDDSSTLSDTPKLNLRSMLLEHMKNVDTDSDEDTLDFTGDTKLRMNGASEDNHYGSDTETRLNEVDVIDWRVQDVCEWLELIGFSYLRPAFAKKMVSGKVLTNTNPDMNILDQIRFENPEDREIIQSEICALQMTNDEEMEMAILDALDKANDTNTRNAKNDKFATMNGGSLRQHVKQTPPTKRSSIPIKTPPNITLDETSSLNLSGEYQNDADNTSINSRNSRNSTNSRNSRNSRTSRTSRNSGNSKEDLKKRLGNDVYDPSEEDWKANELTDSPGQSKLKKKTKKKGFFSSLRKKKAKKDDTAIGDENVQAITHSNPKGMVTIGYSPPNGGNEMEIKLLISMSMTSLEVCNLCLDHLGLNEDVKCYCIIAVTKKNKKAHNMELSPADSPLMAQCKWNDDDNNWFELKNKIDGHIIINNEDIHQDEMITYKLGISTQTTAKDVIPVLLKVFQEKEEHRYFWLAQGENETRVADNCLLLNLPLNGQKFNVFKLVNTSPHYLKQRKMSYNDKKDAEDKVSLLEKQVDKLSTLNEEYRRSEEHLAKENDKLNMERKKQGDEVIHRSNDVKILQDQITTLTQKLRLSSSLNEGPSKEENEKLKQKITELQYNLKTMEQSMKGLKDAKSAVEKEFEDTLNKCKKMENLTEELREQLEHVREEKRSKTTDNTEQMNKLYNENKEYLKSMRSLEDKLSETEQRLSELQIGHDVESTEELSELRNRIDSLDSAVLAKDTRILELEYKVQQKERELKDTLEQWEDECRKSRKESEMRDNAESRYEDLAVKIDNLRLQLSDKEKQIQNHKGQSTKLEKKLNKQKYILDNERNQKLQEVQELNKHHQNELNVLLEKVQNGDKLLVENDLSMKELAFDLSKEKEDLAQLNTDIEKKSAAKDIIIDRLESKIAKADLNLSSKLQEQGEFLLSKDEKIHKAEVEIARLESEHASKLREMSNAIRSKESLITKLEARFRKLEMSSGENVKKFEKYVSEKDRLLQQVTSDHDKTFKDLRSRTRELEEMLKEKDKKLRDAMRQYGEVKATADARLKKREKEYKRQKFLLEKVLKLVNDKAPSLLRQLHESLDCENQSLDNM